MTKEDGRENEGRRNGEGGGIKSQKKAAKNHMEDLMEEGAGKRAGCNGTRQSEEKATEESRG